MKQEKINIVEKESYIAPDLKVVEIEMEQNIFAGSGEGTINDMDAEDWW